MIEDVLLFPVGENNNKCNGLRPPGCGEIKHDEGSLR